MVISGLLAYGYTVSEQLNLGEIGIYGNLGYVLDSVDISLGAKVYERCWRRYARLRLSPQAL